MSERPFFDGLHFFQRLDSTDSYSLIMFKEHEMNINNKFDRMIMMDLVSGALSCDRADICLLVHAPTKKEGVPYTGVFLYYDYSPDVNELLKTSGHAYFCRQKIAWRLCPDHEETDLTIIRELLHLHFAYLIDIGDDAIYENQLFASSK